MATVTAADSVASVVESMDNVKVDDGWIDAAAMQDDSPSTSSTPLPRTDSSGSLSSLPNRPSVTRRPSTATPKRGMLPDYPGPYLVGVCHLELAKSEDMEHGLMAALFYPCVVTEKSKNAAWLPGPNRFYVTGYGDFASAPRFLSKTLFNSLLKGIKMPAYLDAELEQGTWPVVVFSHGLAGMRTTYSSFVGMLASRGFVVLVIEHRDGTASASAFNDYTTPIPYANPQPSTSVPPKQKTTTSNVSAQPKSVTMPFIPEFKGRLDLGRLVMAGHSFGAATALVALQEDKGDLGFLGGVVLDPWMFAVDERVSIRVPILSIQAQFFHWRNNIECFKTLYDASPNALNAFAVILGTKHQDVSDFPGIAPKLMKALKIAGQTSAEEVRGFYERIVGGWLDGLVYGGEKVIVDGKMEGGKVVGGKEGWELLVKGCPETW
ncbi:platelet-activating factor acetylhydrolase, isoform II-domain-containing protein [Chytridium lagenaria]|nr:platelet-activating factor acetylhydrolase, isoform II-domain-containing protein [Chytridium lagenaria]